MRQSVPRTLLLLLAGLLGKALAGFPNTISIGKRPPRQRDPLLPPPAEAKLCGGGAEGEPRQLSGPAQLRLLPTVVSERRERYPGSAGGRWEAEPGCCAVRSPRRRQKDSVCAHAESCPEAARPM